MSKQHLRGGFYVENKVLYNPEGKPLDKDCDLARMLGLRNLRNDLKSSKNTVCEKQQNALLKGGEHEKNLDWFFVVSASFCNIL